MAKISCDATITMVKDPKSGRSVVVKGAGALKGKMTISKRVDLTKPIATIATGARRSSKAGTTRLEAAKQ